MHSLSHDYQPFCMPHGKLNPIFVSISKVYSSYLTVCSMICNIVYLIKQNFAHLINKTNGWVVHHVNRSIGCICF